MDRRPRPRSRSFPVLKFSVLGSLGPVFFRSFSSLETGLTNTSESISFLSRDHSTLSFIGKLGMLESPLLLRNNFQAPLWEANITWSSVPHKVWSTIPDRIGCIWPYDGKFYILSIHYYLYIIFFRHISVWRNGQLENGLTKSWKLSKMKESIILFLPLWR